MRKLCAGNWKMNGLKADALALVRDLRVRAAEEGAPCDLLVSPPATVLAEVAAALAGSALSVGGQDCHAEDKGAFTGDVSAPMLKDAGCTYVIVGHSERRAGHGESDAVVCAKGAAARRAGLKVIFCIGETLAQRDAGQTLAVVARQIEYSLPPGLEAGDFAVAYEPIWAIGTGRTPTVGQVAEVHLHIRHALATKARDPKEVRILYGGSVRPENAAALMGVANVDGALVGGASLVAADFWAIARACG